MGKSTHFFGQPLYGQVIKLLDKSKIFQISRENGGERYTKRFNIWVHLVVMLYAVIMRFDSLMEITIFLLAEEHQRNYFGLTFKIFILSNSAVFASDRRESNNRRRDTELKRTSAVVGLSNQGCQVAETHCNASPRRLICRI